jgi:hypothetical protein
MSDTITPARLEELRGLLQAKFRGQVRDVRVLLRDGLVVLQGIAISYYAKQLAQHLVLHTLHKAALRNEIDVRRVVPEPEASNLEAR